MAFGNFTLTAQFFGLDGVTPAVGRVTIDGLPQVIIDTGSNKIRVGPRTVVLDATGAFSTSLPSDSTTGNSGSIAFRVTPNLKHQNLDPVTFYARPINSTVDLKSLTTQAITALTPTTIDALKMAARNPDLIIAGTVTRDANGAATSAPVMWPDGTPGTYTATTVSTAFPGAVDAYQITYGSPVTKTYTQPLITRNSDGAATNVPAIVVS